MVIIIIVTALLPNQQHVFVGNHLRLSFPHTVQCGIHIASRIVHIAIRENLPGGETNEV